MDECYFCLVNVKGFNKKNKQHLQYPSIPPAIRPVPHGDQIPVPVFTKLPSIDEDQLTFSTSSAISDEEKECEAWDTDRVSLYSQSELNDLIRDLNLP